MNIEVLKRVLKEAQHDERHNTNAETRYWCSQYKAIAEKAIAALAAQSAPPRECQTEAEKTAFAFGWWKALEAQPAQRKPLKLWTEAQHERAYRNSPELHKDVKSLAAFKRVAKEIAAMYGIKEKNT